MQKKTRNKSSFFLDPCKKYTEMLTFFKVDFSIYSLDRNDRKSTFFIKIQYYIDLCFKIFDLTPT